MKYVNQIGPKRSEDVKKDLSICNSCKYNKTFFTLPSMKKVKRCSKTGTTVETLQFRQCKYYQKKTFIREIIIGA